VDWQRRQEARVLAGRLLEDAADLSEAAANVSVPDRLATLLAISLGHLLQEALALPQGPERSQMVLGAARELLRLRQSDRAYECAQRDDRDWQAQQVDRARKAEADQRWKEKMKEMYAPFDARLEKLQADARRRSPSSRVKAGQA
jgi:hypothetical protein